MAIPVSARPSDIPGYTDVALDSGDTLTVPDPDGSFLGQGRSIAEMRGAGALGPDMRTAQADMTGSTFDEMGNAIPGTATGRATATLGQAVANVYDTRQPLSGATAAPADAPPMPQRNTGDLHAQAEQVAASADQAGANSMPSAVLIPGTKGGMRETSRTTNEPTVDYRKRLETLLANADHADEAWTRDVTDTVNGMTAQAMAKTQARVATARGREQAAIIEQSKQEDIRRKATADVQAAQQMERNPSRLWGNAWFAISAGIGGIASALLDLRNGTHTAERFWSSIDRTLQADLAAQENKRGGAIESAKQKLGDADGSIAKLVTESRYYRDLADGLQDAHDAMPVEAQGKILAFKDRAFQRSQELQAKAVMAQEGRVSATQTYQAGRAAQLLMPEDAALRQIGMTQEGYTKAMTAKAGSGENAPTNAQALENVKAVRADAATLEALAKDGVLTSDKVVWNKLSDASRRGLASLGLDVQSGGAINRDKIRLIVGDRLNEYARSFGGAITDSDRETAKATMGQTVEAQLAFLKRMAQKAESSVAASLNAQRLGLAGPLIRLQLGAVNRTGGVPQGKLEAY